jgi:hypothetical protein
MIELVDCLFNILLLYIKYKGSPTLRYALGLRPWALPWAWGLGHLPWGLWAFGLLPWAIWPGHLPFGPRSWGFSALWSCPWDLSPEAFGLDLPFGPRS